LNEAVIKFGTGKGKRKGKELWQQCCLLDWLRNNACPSFEWGLTKIITVLLLILLAVTLSALIAW
jgi:hypothetical protein